jgi:hypothetical protein
VPRRPNLLEWTHTWTLPSAVDRSFPGGRSDHDTDRRSKVACSSQRLDPKGGPAAPAANTPDSLGSPVRVVAQEGGLKGATGLRWR